nr:hypothetical protein Itr_chr10CG00970 [Ipomoea trifida]
MTDSLGIIPEVVIRRSGVAVAGDVETRRAKQHPFRHRVRSRAEGGGGASRRLLNVAGGVRRRDGERRGGVREVELGVWAPQSPHRHVIGHGRHFRRGKRPQPNPVRRPRLPNLRHPFPGALPPPHSPVS